MMPAWILTPWVIITGLLALAALAVEIIAFVIALKAPAAAYIAAGKLSKGAWVAITAIAMVIGLGAAPLPLTGGRGFGGLLSVASVIAALVFMVDVRPAIKGYTGDGRPSGPAQGGW
jgi:hypothetical protein